MALGLHTVFSMKAPLFLMILLCFGPLRMVSAAERCENVFKSFVDRSKLVNSAPSGLQKKDFDAVKTPDQLKAYAENLIAQKLDPVSTVIALWETQFSKDAKWLTDDVLKFLLNLEMKRGLALSSAPFPHTDPRFIHTTSIESRFDIERYVIARLLMSEMPPVISQRLMDSNYVKANNLDFAEVEAVTAVAAARITQIRDWYLARSNFGRAMGEAFLEQSAALEKGKGEILSKEVRNEAVLNLLTGDSPENPNLRVVWRVNYPENPVEISKQYWYLRSAKKITRDYVMEANPELPYAGVNRLMGHPEPDFRFFESVYKNYQDRIRDEIVMKVKEVEATLPVLRQSYGIVFEGQGNEPVGTIRIFDGTPRRINDVFLPGRAETSPVLPLEAIFKARNIPVDFVKRLEGMRRSEAYTPVFEIGKLSLSGSAEVRNRSMKALELFLLQYYLSRYPNGLYLVHVASEAHLMLYRKRYGFKVLETVRIPGTDQVEHILGLSGVELRAALLKRLNL